MRRRWVGKNVDLESLSRCAGDFLKDMGFKIRIDESAGEYKILLGSQPAPDRRENVDIRIIGDPNDFVVEFSADRRARSAILFGYITTMIGGGNLLLRGLKSLERLRRLEKEFWMHIEHCVEHLTHVR
ncbi:MAG: hypothetical protein OEZ25_02670 [Candidatus Bathyarchaeota archaeon]|nr:hypothetical protein [Candidatus Bathyarchaeota archaeon]